MKHKKKDKDRKRKAKNMTHEKWTNKTKTGDNWTKNLIHDIYIININININRDINKLSFHG